MEYGKVEDLTTVDWSFPKDDPLNISRLSSDQTQLKLHLGSPAWGARSWIDKIYPKHTPADKFLHFYSRAFTCIELNRSHYGIPNEKMTSEWLEEVPRNFLFCPKVFKGISHGQFGLHDKYLLKEWTSFIGRLGSNLGPCFIQFHESFSYERKADLFHFLESWPAEFKLSVELRHPSWFKENTILPPLADYLCKKGIGLVITDVAGKREVLHTSVSAPWTMIRLIGNDLHSSDGARLRDWARQLQIWSDLGLKEAYLLLHQPDDILTIEFAQLAHEVFTSFGYLDFPKIEKIKQRDLFDF